MNRSFSVRWLALVLIAGITLNLIHAQTAPIASQPTQNLIGYQLGECEADQRVWQEIVQVTDPKGNTLFQTNQAYVELASGLNYWDATSKQWLESKEEIDAYPGGAIAQYGQHKVIFASDLNSAVAIDQQTPDGQRLQSHVIGLGYFDPASGKSVSIAVVTDSTGQIIPPNQVIYTNAFTDVRADVCFTYTKAGLEQDVILRGRLPAPEMFGLSSATARLQVLTEFVSAPQPVIEAVQLPASAGGLADDQTLDFGAMKMRPGKAFVVGATKDDLAGIPVRKQWVTIDGRTILIEDVAISAIAGRLASLTAPVNQRILNARKDSVLHVVSTRPLLPAPKAGKAAKPAMKIAKRQVSSQGVVLDYTTMTDRTNFTFQADTTYYISGTVNLSGYTTVEGGTVLKYANTNTAKVRIYGSAYSSFNLQTSPYHPAIFTSKNDNTVGEAISGSTGSPAPGNATYLEIHGDGYYSPPVRNARFLFASNAISQVDFYNTLSPVWDCQFVQCGTAFRATPTYSSYPLELHNVLFSKCGVLFADASGGMGQGVIGEQVTADQIGYLLYSSGYYGGCDVFLTNSILTAVGPIYPVTGSTNLDSSLQQDTSTGIYQSVGAANYYLASGTYQGQGNHYISPGMLAELANKTTYPPTVLTGGFVPGSVLTRNPLVVRDNTGTPDLGYHYDPLDYCWSGLNITYDLMLTNGVAVGFYGSSGLNGGSLLVSQGTPLILNHLGFYSAVQEQPLTWGTRLSANYLLNASPGTLKMSFTDLSLAGVSAESLTDNNLAFNLILWDSQWLAVKFNPSYAPYSPITIGFTNNLIQRCTLNFGSCGTAYAVNFRNNLFLYGSLNFALCSYNYNFYQLVTLEDNLFAKCAFGYSTYYGYGPRDISYNGYYQTTVLHGTAPSGYGPAVSGGDVLITNLDFQTGPLGNYYYPVTGTNLARLIDAGNMSASAAGLNTYTTQTNSTPDTNAVDVGFHYSTFLDLTTQCRSDGIVLFWNVPDWIGQEYYLVGFNIYRAESPGGPYVLANAVSNASQRMFVDNNLVIGQTYYYKVTFLYYDPVTWNLLESPYSNEANSSMCPPPPPPPCPIRSGFDGSFLVRNDDNQGVDNLLATLPFTINFYGTLYSQFYVNNNGNVTFDSDLNTWTPEALVNLGRDIIAPFWADVDTRNDSSDVVRYGAGTVDGTNAFGVEWVNVGYYAAHADKLLSVQLVLIDRSDIAVGDFDIEFNYCKVQWEAGDASGGSHGYWQGQWGESARTGFASSSGGSDYFEFTDSGVVPGAFLDSNLTTGLIYNSFNSSAQGRYVFQFSNGYPEGLP
jgi:hypothetical protein